jgi:hypothetical protein
MVARTLASICLASTILSGSVVYAAGEDTPKPDVVLRALPRVPTRASMLKDIDPKDTDKATSRARQWADDLIKAKEKRATEELEIIKKKVLESERARLKEQQERMRKREKYDQAYGIEATTGDKRAAVRVKLDFVVLEIDHFRRIADIYRLQEQLATDVVTALPKLDRDGDGKLTDDEYRDAAAIVSAASRLFVNLDVNEDGFVSESESDAAKGTPSTAIDAIQAGRISVDTPGYKIKNYDTDGDGALSVQERKELGNAFLAVAIQAGRDAIFYRTLTDALSISRQIAATKFENIEVVP